MSGSFQRRKEVYASSRSLRVYLRRALIDACSGAVYWSRNLSPKKDCVRVVLYHHVFREDQRRFEEHLRWYRDHFDVIPLRRAVELIQSPSAFSGRYLAITVDDGFKNNIQYAAPLLDRMNIHACFFIATDFIDLAPGDSDLRRQICLERLLHCCTVENMNWDDIMCLQVAGHEIGSHGLSHRRFSMLPDGEISRELRQSFEHISSATGQPPQHFSWPYGCTSDVPPGFFRNPALKLYTSVSSGVRGRNPSHRHYLFRDQVDSNWSLREIRYFLFR